MTLLQLILLAIVQGVAELLPVSSSAHVIAVERLLGLDPSSPKMTFLLVMLHTGTMFAVIGYFWSSWRARYFASSGAFRHQAKLIVLATALTGVVGIALLLFIEHIVLSGSAHAEIEQLFGNADLMAAALAAAGVLIVVSGRRTASITDRADLGSRQAAWIGMVQGLCLPFRGFSRSGATISTGLLLGVERSRAEEFSFALAVVLTPPVILKEAYRLIKAEAGIAGSAHDVVGLLGPGLLGMGLSFVAGWLALRWLSRWLESGHWHWFGYYCLVAASVVYLTR